MEKPKLTLKGNESIEERKRRNWSSTTFAKQSLLICGHDKIGEKSVRDIEKRKPVSIKLATTYAKTLGLDVSKIFSGLEHTERLDLDISNRTLFGLISEQYDMALSSWHAEGGISKSSRAISENLFQRASREIREAELMPASTLEIINALTETDGVIKSQLISGETKHDVTLGFIEGDKQNNKINLNAIWEVDPSVYLNNDQIVELQSMIEAHESRALCQASEDLINKLEVKNKIRDAIEKICANGDLHFLIGTATSDCLHQFEDLRRELDFFQYEPVKRHILVLSSIQYHGGNLKYSAWDSEGIPF
ncbi:hypothetical protein OAC04_01290 [Gammaproteobacteria bacterium]|nr:hypothetical protein [Gammaproteobacteria bacterium]